MRGAFMQSDTIRVAIACTITLPRCSKRAQMVDMLIEYENLYTGPPFSSP